MKVLIFLRQTEGKSNWKIDTISVVQELKVHGASRELNIERCTEIDKY